MSTSFYYMHDGHRVGPVSDHNLRAAAARGQLDSDDLVWAEGSPDWVRAATIPAPFPMAAPVATVPPAARAVPAAIPAPAAVPVASGQPQLTRQHLLMGGAALGGLVLLVVIIAVIAKKDGGETPKEDGGDTPGVRKST